MSEQRQSRRFRPADWPFATKVSLVPSLLLVITGLVLMVVTNHTIFDLQSQSVLNNFELVAQSQARRVTQTVVREVSLLNTFAQDTLLIEHTQEHLAQAEAGTLPDTHEEFAPELVTELLLFQRRNPQFEVVMVVDANGTLIASTQENADEHGSFDEEAWHLFSTSGEHGRLFISEWKPEVAMTGTSGMEIALPILNQLDEPLGAVYAVWDLSDAAGATAGIQSSRVTIVNRDGLIVADSMEGTVGQTGFGEELTRSFRENLEGATIAEDIQANQFIYGYSDIVGQTDVTQFEGTGAFQFDVVDPIRSMGWTVIVSQPVDEALEGTSLLIRRIVGLILGGTAVLVILVFAFSTTLVGPVTRLTEAARSIAAGQLETPIPELGADEIGQLAAVLRLTVSRLTHRVEQLQTVAEVARLSQRSLELHEMLDSVAEVVHQQFAYPSVYFYLLDAEDDTVMTLAAAAGDVAGDRQKVGQEMSVASVLMVNDAIRRQREQLARGTDTTSGKGAELVLPMLGGGRSLGAMRVLASDEMAFAPASVNTLELVADQVASSVQTARLFEQSTASLEYIEALNRRLTREGWQEYVGHHGQIRFALRADDAASEWPAEMGQVAESGMPLIEDYGDDGQAVLAIPVVLRGEVIGTLGIKRPAERTWADDEIALVQAVADRVGLIAEGIRLLDEADRVAQREQLVSSVSARLQRATQVDSLLQVALNELGGALGSDNISLRIGTPPEDDGEGE